MSCEYTRRFLILFGRVFFFNLSSLWGVLLTFSWLVLVCQVENMNVKGILLVFEFVKRSNLSFYSKYICRVRSEWYKYISIEKKKYRRIIFVVTILEKIQQK